MRDFGAVREAVMNLATALRSQGRKGEAETLVWRHIRLAEEEAARLAAEAANASSCTEGEGQRQSQQVEARWESSAFAPAQCGSWAPLKD